MPPQKIYDLGTVSGAPDFLPPDFVSADEIGAGGGSTGTPPPPDYLPDADAGLSTGDKAKSWFNRYIMSPLVPQIGKAADTFSNWIDPNDPIKGRSTGGVRGVTSAFVEALGHELSGLTSPANLALTTLTGPLGDVSAPVVGRLGRLGAAAGAAQGVHGAVEALGPHRTTDERLQGLADLVMGGAGVYGGVRGEMAGPPVRPPTPVSPKILSGAERFTPTGGTVDALDPRFVGRPAPTPAPWDVPDPPSPFTGPYERSGGPPVDFISATDARHTFDPAPWDTPDPPSPFTRYGETQSPTPVDPTDPRFDARRQGTLGAEYAPDPFASPLDRASQPPLAPAARDPHVDALAEFFGVGQDEPRLYEGEDAPLGREPMADPLASPTPTPTAVPPSPPSTPRDLEATYRNEPALAPLVHAYDTLAPKWEQAVTAQAGDQIPFTVDPRETLPEFIHRIVDTDSKGLMGKERYAVEDATRLAGEPGLAAFLKGTEGSGPGLTPEQLAAAKDTIGKWRYFSMLGPGAQIKNVLGNVGAVAGQAAEMGLAGRGRDALSVLHEFFHPQTARDVRGEFVNPSEAGRWGNEQGALGVPGRAMGAVDRATKDALERAGIGDTEAHQITFTNRPRTKTGQALADLLNQQTLLKQAVPFGRTAINITERGLERTPGLGYLASLLSDGTLKTSVPMQVLGAAAMGAGASGMLDHVPKPVLPFVQALAASYALPLAMGEGIHAAGKKIGSTGYDFGEAALKALLEGAPIPDEQSFDPRSILASYVPTLFGPVNYMAGIDPSTFDTSHSLTGKAIAKIPFLNEALLRRSTHTPRAAR